MMTITETAAKKILAAVEEAPQDGDGLRVRVIGGGCSGLQYKLGVDSRKKGDKVFDQGGAKLYVDRRSYLYLAGTEVGYSDGLYGAGFQLGNPNVKRTCGCGESFMV